MNPNKDGNRLTFLQPPAGHVSAGSPLQLCYKFVDKPYKLYAGLTMDVRAVSGLSSLGVGDNDVADESCEELKITRRRLGEITSGSRER